MAKRRTRTPAQRAATKRMLAARRHRNPSPAPRTYRRRRVANPAPVAYRRRRHRNPSSGGGGIMGELMSKDGLMMIAAVVGTPTLTELAAQYLMPTASGTTKSLVKAALGFGIGYGVYKFVNKKAGTVVALVAAGHAVTDLINSYMSPRVPTVGTSAGVAPAVVGGYTQRKAVSMSGYTEPGMVRL